MSCITRMDCRGGAIKVPGRGESQKELLLGSGRVGGSTDHSRSQEQGQKVERETKRGLRILDTHTSTSYGHTSTDGST